MRLTTSIKLLSLWLLLLGSQSSASTVVGASIGEIALRAEFVYAGTVTDTICFVSEDGMGVTEYRFGQVDVVKSGKFGSVGRLRLVGMPPSTIAGQPTLSIGVRYIVFSTPEFYSAGRGRGAIVGLNQGLYRIGTDYRGRQNSVLDHDGRPVVRISEKHAVVVDSEDRSRVGQSRARIVANSELPPKRRNNSTGGGPPRARSHAVELKPSNLPPSSKSVNPPDPPELDYIKSKAMSLPPITSGAKVETISKSSDRGDRMTEAEFLQAVRTLVAGN